ncbi:MAG: BamA/TamA family outer membrane protein [Bacteroidota bacterium]
MLVVLFSLFSLFSQSPQKKAISIIPDKNIAIADTTQRNVLIDNIFIIGNKVTKSKIILREVDIEIGKSYRYDKLQDLLKVDRNRIQNLRLFNSVEISILDLSTEKVDIVIVVKERWYTFPSPIFDLADRNFNDWLQNRDGSFSRTNFGIKLNRNNFRGRNEELRLTLQFGFTRKFNLVYRIPYIDQTQRHGISFLFDYSENNNIAFQTEDHIQSFYDADELLRTEQTYGVGYTFRNSFYIFHRVNLSFNYNTVRDTVAILNPEYYKNSNTSQRYFTLRYGFTYDKRDFNPYPLKGRRFDFDIRKFGLSLFDDLDQWEIKLGLSQHYDLGKKFFFSNYTSLSFTFPSDQPYSNFNAMGFKKDVVRGYELYLIEGPRFGLSRSTFKRRILSTKKRVGLIPLEQFREIPLDIYIKTYFDMGYVHNYDNYRISSRLADRYIFGTGLGVDFVTYYDTVIRFEYSVNRENEGGLFFHLKKEF